MSVQHYDLVRVAVSSAPGTGSTISLGAAVTGFRDFNTWSGANAPDGAVVIVGLSCANGTETLNCTYNKTPNTLTINSVIASSNSGSLVNAGADAIVFDSLSASELGNAIGLNAGTAANNLVQLNGSAQLPALDGSLLTGVSRAVGLVNGIRNGGLDIWQRGTSFSVTTSGAYTADGWIVLPTGASVGAVQGPGRLLTKNSLQLNGVAGLTASIVRQRIESSPAAQFASQVVTLQAQIYNATGAAIIPTLSVGYPATADTYTSVGAAALTNVLNGVSLQSCANAAWTNIAYTFFGPASAANGLEVNFNFGAIVAGEPVRITEVDIRVTPSASVGLNSNPPLPELRPIPFELLFCQRYFATSFPNGTAPANAQPGFLEGAGFYYTSTLVSSQFFPFPVQMRIAPTVTLYSSNIPGTPTAGQWSVIPPGGSWGNGSSTAANPITTGGFLITLTAGSSTIGYGTFVAGGYAASAEL